MSRQDHLHDAIDLVRARVSGRLDAEAVLLANRGLDTEVAHHELLFSQTRVAAMLARSLAIYEGRTVEQVLDSLAVAVLEVEGLADGEDRLLGR